MPAISPVVDLGYDLACRGDDPASVKHHACDGVVVGVGVDDGAGAEVPLLEVGLARVSYGQMVIWGGKKGRTHPYTAISTASDQVLLVEL